MSTSHKVNIVGSSCNHPQRYHIPCGWENISSSECHDIGCCFGGIIHGCYHSLPSAYQYTTVGNIKWQNDALLQPIRKYTPYNNVTAAENVRLHVAKISKKHLQLIFHTGDTGAGNKDDAQELDYDVQIFSKLIFVEVKRRLNSQLLFSSSQGPLIVAENFFEWSFFLGGSTFHGLGESILSPNRKYLLVNNGKSSALPVITVYGE
jgi:hypothetical protein